MDIQVLPPIVAAQISVSIERSGARSIRVQDNGSGIPADQVATAFSRHATSKLRTADDLRSIATLGFRGEALPSIAAVSARMCVAYTALCSLSGGLASRRQGRGILPTLG